jgi:hypothetical protein
MLGALGHFLRYDWRAQMVISMFGPAVIMVVGRGALDGCRLQSVYSGEAQDGPFLVSC